MDALFLVLFVTVAGYEIAALIIKRRGDTISEKTWSARDHSLLTRIFVDSFIVWVTWHLIIDPVVAERGAGIIDVLFLALGAAWAAWSWRKQHGG